MEAITLSDIPFEPNTDRLAARVRIRPGSAHEDAFLQLVGEAASIAKPKALYRIAYVSQRTDNAVTVDGVTLTSRVLRVNLDQAYRVFPYAATCGVELDEWAATLDDLLSTFWSDAIRQDALSAAGRAVSRHIIESHGLGKTATMSPGSLGDWPLREQRQLFDILGDAEATIGVRLTKSCLMLPTKSISGIRFPTEQRFESCQLCPRDVCPGRRAPYDPELYERRYQRAK
jgi:hypothetical protein